MSALKLGENVMFADDGGHWRKGQVWSLHSEAHWYWIVCEGRMYARKGSALNSMRTQHTQEALV